MIEIIEGDLFTAEGVVIAHQVNCRGVWGSGVAYQAKRYFPFAYTEYRKRVMMGNCLGTIQIIPLGSKGYICNMFAQDDIGKFENGKIDAIYTDLDAFRKCIERLYEFAEKNKLNVAMPYKIGSVRGGANWADIYYMLEEVFGECSRVNLTLYKLNKD